MSRQFWHTFDHDWRIALSWVRSASCAVDFVVPNLFLGGLRRQSSSRSSGPCWSGTFWGRWHRWPARQRTCASSVGVHRVGPGAAPILIASADLAAEPRPAKYLETEQKFREAAWKVLTYSGFCALGFWVVHDQAYPFETKELWRGEGKLRTEGM